MPIVIGGSSGRPVVSGCAWEPRVTQPETFVEGRREILRQASIALGGRPVTVWEVSARAELEPQASSEPAPTHHTTKLDVDATLRRWNIAIVQGSRWVGCQGAADGFWVVAPVRTRPPAPPPEGRERRSRERLTLELAGLCLGLLDRREPTPGHPPAARSDPLNDITTLPGIIAHELSNPLTAARAGLHLAMESLGRWTEVAAGRRLELLDELGQVVEDIDRSASFLRAVQDRAHDVEPLRPRQGAARTVLDGPQEARRAVDILHHLAELVEQLEPPAGGDLRPAPERLHREVQAGARGRQGIRQLVRDDTRERRDIVQRIRSCGRRVAGRRLTSIEQPEAQPGELEGESFPAAALPAFGRGRGWPRAHRGDHLKAIGRALTPHPTAALHDGDVPAPQRGIDVQLGGVMGRCGLARGLGLELRARGHLPDRDGTAAEGNARLAEDLAPAFDEWLRLRHPRLPRAPRHEDRKSV